MTTAWQPMKWVKHVADPDGDHFDVWENAEYVAGLRSRSDGLQCITVHRHDRSPLTDWRVLQSVKNELCGSEREGAELFPAESRLVDASCERHIWVLPQGERFPFGLNHRTVLTPEEAEQQGATQRAWQPGLTTGVPA